MKKFLFVCYALLAVLTGLAQTRGKNKALATGSYQRVRFTARFHQSMATKDGFYIGGYVVNIPTDRTTALDGKLIEISGVVTIEPATQNHGLNDSTPISQGRSKATKRIESPKIRIIQKVR